MNFKKVFRGYSWEEVQYKKRKWIEKDFNDGLIWIIVRESIKPCIFFGNQKLIVEFV